MGGGYPLAYKADVGRWITAHMDEVSAKAEARGKGSVG